MSNQQKVLIVEDDESIVEALRYTFEKEGYLVYAALDGEDALNKVSYASPHLVILDIMLPKLDGIEVCRILRRESEVPIIMLSAKTDEADRIVGLEMGADDYMTKPFSMRELVARVRARLRRSMTTRQPELPSIQHETFVSQDIEIDLRSYTAKRNGAPLELKPKEFELLVMLIKNRGRVCTRDFILDEIWGNNFRGSEHTLAVHIRWLREKIEADPGNPVRIITIRGVGYRFEK
jgi:DNA-binding response OmpR family regulator